MRFTGRLPIEDSNPVGKHGSTSLFREFINFAVDGCKRMQTLINDLLAFSRVGTQGKPLEVVPCEAVLDRVLESLKVAIQESGAVITRERLPVVLAD